MVTVVPLGPFVPGAQIPARKRPHLGSLREITGTESGFVA
jgi:hypothetical protein